MIALDLTIPTIAASEPAVELALLPGQPVFILGANGAGKSGLMHHLHNKNRGKCVRLAAHRQTWLTSDSPELTPHSKRRQERRVRQEDWSPESRWRDPVGSIRASMAVFDLVNTENVRARLIAAAVDENDIDRAQAEAAESSPTSIINELLALAGIPIEVAVYENERILARRNNSEPYSIAELSDGERSALLLAATVLTAPEDSLVLIDEPERHLHRSIASPLLSHLFSRRPDCRFLVSTHELLLPMDHPDATTLLLRECSFDGSNAPRGWSIDVLPGNAQIPEGTKLDILGARRRILFVEGTEESLDKPLYGILFPDVTVVPKGSCTDVERATMGVRSTQALHWTQAFGLIDRDGRTDDEVKQLQAIGICAIPLYSVESVYYHPAMLAIIAHRVARVDGSDHEERVARAREVGLEAAREHRDRMCRRVANWRLREHVLRRIPNLESGSVEPDDTIAIPGRALLESEHAKFDAAIASGDLLAVVQRYPIRETAALLRIAKELGFRSRRSYEAAVLQACRTDATSRAKVLGWLGSLEAMLSGNGC